jgi:nucleoside-diphosphate-sugar epimerase
MDSPLPTTLALTGGTGALGFAFLRHQFQRQPQLRARLLVRRASASFQSGEFQQWLRENEERVTLVDGDMTSLGSRQLEALLDTDGGLWHFAALTALTTDIEQVTRDIRAVNLAGTERLVRACLERGMRAPFYHISTAYVAGHRRGVVLESEGDLGQAFRNPYEESKLGAEVCVQHAFAAGLNGAIFRPSVVVDDNAGTGGFKIVDACAYAVALAVKRGEPFVFRTPDHAGMNLVHSDWVIAAMSDLARLPSGPGRTYHLTAPEPTRFRQIAAILEKMVPALRVSFEPDWKRAQLPTASKIFDKAITELYPYFVADIHFDRANTGRDLSPDVQAVPLDLVPFVARRLESELARVAHRQPGPSARVLPEPGVCGKVAG